MLRCVIFRQHFPAEPLSRYVDWLWFFEKMDLPHRREHVLPDGTFELIINLHDDRRWLFDREDPRRDRAFRGGWVSGAQSRYIVIDAVPGSSMMGVHFKPGGAAAILGMPADLLRDQVVELDTIWGSAADDLREQLLAARGPQAKLQTLERCLSERLAARTPDLAHQRRIFWARDLFLQDDRVANVGAVVEQLGMSHKHFIEQFRRHVGITPKLFCRIQRFQRVLAELSVRRRVEWADVAASCGYFDQSHFVHDFQNFSGLNPSTYVQDQPEYANFVPVETLR